MESVRLRLVFPSHHNRKILSKSHEELSKSWFLLNPSLHPTVADVSSQICSFFKLNQSCPYGIKLSMDGFVLPPYESSCILKDKDLIRVKKKKGKTKNEIVDKDEVNLIEGDDVAKDPIGTEVLLLEGGRLDNESGVKQNEIEEGEINLVEDQQLVDQSTGQDSGSKKRKKSKKRHNEKVKRKRKTPAETADVADGIESAGKEEIMEKQHTDTSLLHRVHEEFEKENNVNQGKYQEKEGSLLEENLVVKEVNPKKRKASEELDSPKKKKKQAGWLYRFFESGEDEQDEPSPNREKGKSSMALQDTESDIHVEQNEANQCKGLSSEMNVDDIEKSYGLANKHGKKNASSSAGGNYEIVEPLPVPNSVLQESGAKSDGVPQISKGTKKLCRGTLKQYKMRKLRKELKAEAKELLAENVLLRSSIRNLPTRSVKRQQHNQSAGVVKPQHIRFEPYEKEENAEKSQVAEETSEPNETIIKKKNQKLGQERRVYCTRSNFKKLGEECLQVVTLEKENSDKDAEFNKLPLLSTCPKEGDIIAYRVLEQSPETGPILSSFRVGRTLRLDNWARMLILMPVEENPVVPEKSDIGLEEQRNSETGACEQQKDKSHTNVWEHKQKSDTGGREQVKNKSDTNAWEQQQYKSDTRGWEQQKNKSDANAWGQKQDKSDTNAWDQGKSKSDTNAWEQKQSRSDTGGWEQKQGKSDTNAWEKKNSRSDSGGWGKQKSDFDTNAWQPKQNESDTGGWERQKSEPNTKAWEQNQNKSDTVGWEQGKIKSDANAWEQNRNRSETNAWEQQKGKSYTNAWEPWKNKSDTNAWGKQQQKSDTGGWEQWKRKSDANACGQEKHKSDTGGWVQQQNKSDTGAWEQPKMDYIDKQSGHIEIDIETLYDVRIVKHSSLPEKVVDKWDSISQTAELRTALLTKRREWGKGGPTATSNNQQWPKVGPTATSTKQEWTKGGPTTKSTRKEWGKEGNNVGSNRNSWSTKPFNKNAKQEWVKKGPTPWKKESSNEKKDWGKVGPTRGTWKKEGGNVGSNAKKGWGKVNPNEESNSGPTTSSWSSKQFDNEKQSENAA